MGPTARPIHSASWTEALAFSPRPARIARLWARSRFGECIVPATDRMLARTRRNRAGVDRTVDAGGSQRRIGSCIRRYRLTPLKPGPDGPIRAERMTLPHQFGSFPVRTDVTHDSAGDWT